MAQWFSCNGCAGSDPTSDTVKVDASLLAAAGKENVQPALAPEKAHESHKVVEEQQKREQEMRAAEERRHLEEQAKRRREEEDAKRRREEEIAAERQALQEAAERERMVRAAAEADARAKAEQLRLEEERVAEEKARMEREAADEEAKQKEHEAGERVAAWCKKKGVKNMSTKISSLFSGSKFPLHVAVADKDVEIVGMMVLLGVDQTCTNSKGQTAKDLAAKLNKNGSMDAILASLK